MRTRETKRRVARRILRRRARRNLEGLTLVEIMVVLVIVAIIGTGVAIGVFAFIGDAEESVAETSVKEIRRIAMIQYRRTRVCPTPAGLAQEGRIDEDSSTEDPWGNPYEIECEPGRVTVSSAGPDGQMGSEDDITAPRGRANE
jgi:general secretion pathway protein G